MLWSLSTKRSVEPSICSRNVGSGRCLLKSFYRVLTNKSGAYSKIKDYYRVDTFTCTSHHYANVSLSAIGIEAKIDRNCTNDLGEVYLLDK